ncbi:MAG TPA: hypothetical protein DIC52_23200 [Candidatus Latescibacteria bacterium]|nr:hypothetical protein [Candidatus Latescibacterota bacterium]
MAILGVVMAKADITVRFRLMRGQVLRADNEKEKILLNLRAIIAQKKVSDANRATLERKRKRLDGKRQRLHKEHEILPTRSAANFSGSRREESSSAGLAEQPTTRTTATTTELPGGQARSTVGQRPVSAIHRVSL